MFTQKKYRLFIFLLILFLVVSGCKKNEKEKTSFNNIDANISYQMIRQNPDILLLDVRTPKEYAQAHIKKSILIPVQVLEKDYTKISMDKERTVLIYCRSGNRSVTASKILLTKGFKDVYNMKGGIKSWIKNEYPVVSQQ